MDKDQTQPKKTEKQEENDTFVWCSLSGTLDDLRARRPNDRSEMDRRYAVCITEMEKIVAYFNTFVM